LLSFEVIKFIGGKLVDKLEGLLLPMVHGRKKDGVERDVVFADELDKFCMRIAPVITFQASELLFFGPTLWSRRL